MPSALASSSIEYEVGRICERSKAGRHSEALAAAEVLSAESPQNRDVLYLIAANQRCLNRIPEALATLQRLEQQHPRFSLLYQERGHCYMTMRDAPRAIDAFLRGVNINPALATSWIMLERLYRMTGQVENAAKAADQVSILKHLPPEVVRAGSLFSDGDLSAAEKILRAYLLAAGNHVEALRLLIDKFHDVGGTRRLLHLRLCLADRIEGDVVANGVVEQHDILTDQAHLRAQVGQSVLAHIDTVQQHRSLLHIIEARHQTDQSGLAAP